MFVIKICTFATPMSKLDFLCFAITLRSWEGSARHFFTKLAARGEPSTIVYRVGDSYDDENSVDGPN